MMTQFEVKGGGLVQGVTKLITILLACVTLNKNYAIIFRKYMVFQNKVKKNDKKNYEIYWITFDFLNHIIIPNFN